MFIRNTHPDHNKPLAQEDADMLGIDASAEAERFFSHRETYRPTPLHALAALARALGCAALHVKDEGFRLGLGSFKALGGSYAVIRLTLEEASRQFGRTVDIDELTTPEVRAVASGMTFGCATDGNHGKSVAQGAELVGGRAVIFVHSGVSEERANAIARFGASIVRVAGNYDDSVAEASRMCAENGWTVVSDTSWSGYERIPALVMQGYTVMLREILRDLPEPPTHVFIQAGVGGLAAAVAAHFAIVFGPRRPFLTVVEPARAACLYESARLGRPVKIDHGEATVMAMLECYEPSLVAWRILSRAGDAFLTVAEEAAVDAMRRLANPQAGDLAVVAGESGAAGLAGLMAAARDPMLRQALALDGKSRILLINTEGATDPALYARLVGRRPEDVLSGSEG